MQTLTANERSVFFEKNCQFSKLLRSQCYKTYFASSWHDVLSDTSRRLLCTFPLTNNTSH